MSADLIYKIVLAVIIIILIIVVQYLFNPRLNFARKYSEVEYEEEEEKELSEEEKKFYEEIWNAKRKKESEGQGTDERP